MKQKQHSTEEIILSNSNKSHPKWAKTGYPVTLLGACQ